MKKKKARQIIFIKISKIDMEVPGLNTINIFNLMKMLENLWVRFYNLLYIPFVKDFKNNNQWCFNQIKSKLTVAENVISGERVSLKCDNLWHRVRGGVKEMFRNTHTVFDVNDWWHKTLLCIHELWNKVLNS